VAESAAFTATSDGNSRRKVRTNLLNGEVSRKRWRERQTGEGFRGDDKSPFPSVGGTLPDGRTFSNLAEYKQALLAEKEHFIRGFTKKMLTYALVAQARHGPGDGRRHRWQAWAG